MTLDAAGTTDPDGNALTLHLVLLSGGRGSGIPGQPRVRAAPAAGVGRGRRPARAAFPPRPRADRREPPPRVAIENASTARATVDAEGRGHRARHPRRRGRRHAEPDVVPARHPEHEGGGGGAAIGGRLSRGGPRKDRSPHRHRPRCRRVDRPLAGQRRLRDAGEGTRASCTSPSASIEDPRAGQLRHPVPRPLGEPVGRARLLRKRPALRLRHGAGQRAGEHPDPRLPGRRRVAGGRGAGGRGGGLGDEPARVLPEPALDEAVPVRAHDRDHAPAPGRACWRCTRASRT